MENSVVNGTGYKIVFTEGPSYYRACIEFASGKVEYLEHKNLGRLRISANVTAQSMVTAADLLPVAAKPVAVVKANPAAVEAPRPTGHLRGMPLGNKEVRQAAIRRGQPSDKRHR